MVQFATPPPPYEFSPVHTAFLCTDDHFDRALRLLQERGLNYWSDPQRTRLQETNPESQRRLRQSLQSIVLPLWCHGSMAMTLRLNKEDEQLLARLAEQDGVSRHALVINAIHEVAERRGHEAQVSAASKRARERYGDLLDRLGE